MILFWQNFAAEIGCQRLFRGIESFQNIATPHYFLYIFRSNEMLIAFHSSPYSAPLQTETPNRGFELNVDILFTDSDSHDFVQTQMTRDMTIKCEFHINATNPG